MANELQVLTQLGRVGVVSHEALNDSYSFSYEPSWCARPDGFALSPHIPLSAEPAQSATVSRFLANLLPEGRALDVAVAASQLTKDNIFGLVQLLGKEPVGALSFSTEAEQPAVAIRRVISPEELSERIRGRDTHPFAVWDKKVRLSVAGYQDKLQVLVEGDQISLADGTLSSTHILKPDSRNRTTPHMVANEHFCMRLAKEMGLPVADVQLRRVPDPILLIQRFDREVASDPGTGAVTSVRRSHVIDGCQALDLPVSFKYERNYGNAEAVRHIREGVSFEKLFSLERFMARPALARSAVVSWALMQLLIGNGDAHGKNISYHVGPVGLTPAPFYDLVSVSAYAELEQDLAMGYGDVFRLDEITPYALADFAYRTGNSAQFVSRQLTRLCKLAKDAAPRLAQSAEYQGDERILVQDIAMLIARQAEKLLAIAPHIAKVDRGML